MSRIIYRTPTGGVGFAHFVEGVPEDFEAEHREISETEAFPPAELGDAWTWGEVIGIDDDKARAVQVHRWRVRRTSLLDRLDKRIERAADDADGTDAPLRALRKGLRDVTKVAIAETGADIAESWPAAFAQADAVLA